MAQKGRGPPPAIRQASGKSVSVDTLFDNASQNNSRAQATQGLRPIGAIAVEVVANLRFRRKVDRVHSLGPRATAELLAELGAERAIGTLIDQKFDQYAEMSPEALKATGGNDFWPAPVREVRP